MAITASKVTSSQTLEEFRLEFNKLQADVTILKDNPTFASNLVFEGATVDAFETTLNVVDPTADRTINLPNADGTLLLTGISSFEVADGGTIGSATTSNAMTIAADGGITFASASVFSSGVAVTGDITATGTIEPAGDTSAADNAAIGYTSAEGLILTGQGSTSDITLKNDADGTVFTVPTGSDDILFADNAKIIVGTSSDGYLTHDGSHTILVDNGTGNLTLKSNGAGINFQKGDSETMVSMATDGAVTLYHDNSAKLATSSAGISVTGSITTSGAVNPNASDAAALGSASLEWADLFLADAAVINFGDDQDVTLTHVADTGILLNSTMAIQFNDASQYINAPSATVLDINATDEVEVNATLMDVNANLDVSGTGVIAGAITGAAITASGILKTDDTTAATSTTDGSLQTDGGLSVAADAVIGDDLFMLSDAAVVTFGVNKDVTLTHVHDTGLLLNSTMQLQFNDASQYINAPSATVLDINATDEVEVNATLMDVNANLDVSGTIVGASTLSATTGTFSGILKTDDATEATSTTDGSLQTDGGLSVVKDAVFGDDVKLLSDASVIAFGVNGDVTLTHVHDTGILLNSTMAIQFNDASQYINAPSATVLDINATDEIELNATLADINANLDVSGTYTGGGLMTTGGNIVIPDDGSIGSATDTNAITISSAGIIAVTSTTASSSKTTGALTVAGGISTQADIYVGDLLNVEGGINIAGSNQELRFYEGANYVGFEAPALGANQIWVLPAVDADDGDVLMTDGSGTLSWSTAVSGVAANFTVSANNSTNETVYPVFVDGATGGQGAETDTALTYNPSTGLLSTAAITLTGALTVGGTTTLNGALVLGDAAGDALTINATTTVNENMTFTDSDKAVFGTGGDLEIYHDGTDSRIDEVGTGDLIIRSDGTMQLKKQSGAEQMATFAADGAVTLYHNNVAKLATSAAGISVTGSGTFSGAVNPNASDAAALGSASLEWSDLFLADAAVINFGDDQEVTLTHVHDTGLLLNGAMQLQFSDASQFINAPSATVLDINATDEIELNATLVDINANVEISGTATTTGVHTFTAVPVLPANSIDSAHYVDDSIDTAHYAAGSVDATALGADCVTAAKIGDNVINSEHYAAGSIDEEHMAANSIDSDSYVDASIDTAHYAAGSVDATALGADCVTAAKIGDNVINSEHYAADSIDEEHLANDAVGSAELKTLSTLLIKNSSGSTLKTLYGAGA